MARPYRSNGKSMRTPSASSTSADPLCELAARFPCLATRAPAAAATIAAAVDMLKVPEASPPVPQVSTMFAGPTSPSTNTRVAWRRITRAKPASSCTCTGLRLSAVNNRTISGVAMRPASTSSIKASAPGRVRVEPASNRSIRSRLIARRSRSRR